MVEKREKDMKRFFCVTLVTFGILGGLTACTSETTTESSTPATSSDDTTVSAPETTPTSDDTVDETTTAEETDGTPRFTDGTYLVGSDIEPGLYKATLSSSFMGMAYVERASSVNMDFESIIANILLTGDGYVEILESDVAVKVQSAELTPIDLSALEPNIQTELEDGIYLVGYDVAPGTYKVEVTDTITSMGYVQRSRSVAMGFEDIIANDIIQGPSYVEIMEDDFAVQLQGVKITLS